MKEQSTTITVTSRTRSLGYAVSTTPQQNYNSQGTGYLSIKIPTAPEFVGTARQCLEARRRMIRERGINHGTDYAERLFYKGQRIKWEPSGCDLLLHDLCKPNSHAVIELDREVAR